MVLVGQRHRGRRAAVCMLFQRDLSGEPTEAVIEGYFGSLAEDEPLDAATRRFAEQLVRGVAARLDELDALIRSGSDNWRIERMAAVDRNVLRLALFELQQEPDVPAAVILDEAVELAKTFGGEESGSFVNGLADGIRRRLESGQMTRQG